MKRPALLILLLSLLFTALAPLALPVSGAQAQSQIDMRQLKATVPILPSNRRSPCGSTTGFECGTPPRQVLTPAMCGLQISTSSARNADGSTSTEGVTYVLPKAADMAAAGFRAADNLSMSDTRNRAGCVFTFIMGAPLQNYLCIEVDDNAAWPKGWTSIPGGAYDIAKGRYCVEYRSASMTTATWNTNSWLITGGTPNAAELFGQGQVGSHGFGRLFLVTADPSWWTAGTRVGSLAFCPQGGRGMVTNANGGFQLGRVPQACVFRTPAAGSANEWITLYNVTTGVVTGVAAGAAYPAGTAPNGQSYDAGNYVVVKMAALTNYSSGNTVEVNNIIMTGATETSGHWIAKQLTAGVDPGCGAGETCLELHQKSKPDGFGKPSAFVPGDTWVERGNFSYMTLATAGVSGVARLADHSTGQEVETQLGNRTIVGVARRVSGAYVDDPANRLLASLYSPVEKECLTTTASDRTVTSTSFVEVNSDLRCRFMYLNGQSSTSAERGAVGRPLKYEATIGAGNGTAANGCEFTVGFGNGLAAVSVTETARATGFVNPSGVSGGRQTVTVSGHKNDLDERAASEHYITLMARAVTGGTCTIHAGSTRLRATIWQ